MLERALSVPSEAERDAVGRVEQLGVDIIPDQERHGSPVELFWVWAGANIVFSYIIGGSILIALGLSFWQAVITILISAVFFASVGLTAVSGPRAGTATMVVSRGAFGIRGNLAPTFISWLTVVGWQAVNLVLGSFALFALADELGINPTTSVKAGLFSVFAAVTYIVAIFGHATIVFLQKLFTYALAALMAGVLIQVIPDADFGWTGGELAASNVVATMTLGVMILSAFSLGWANYGADYSRYLPHSSSPRSVAFWTIVGGLLPYLTISFIGILAATAADLTDPVGGLEPLLMSWYFVPFLIVVIGGSLTNNFLNTYTSGLTLLALGVRVKRWKTIPIDGVLATAVSVYAIFFHDFTTTFIEFLSLQIIWLAPWATIFIMDMWLKRAEYYSDDLLRRRGGRYWYTAGVSGSAVLAWVAGLVAAFLFTNSTRWQSPISTELLGGADLSVPAGALVAGLLYYTLRRREELGRARGAPEPTPED